MELFTSLDLYLIYTLDLTSFKELYTLTQVLYIGLQDFILETSLIHG